MDIGKERGTLHVWPEGKIPPDRLVEVEEEAIRLLLLDPALGPLSEDPSCRVGEEFLIVCWAREQEFIRPDWVEWGLYRVSDVVAWYQALVREYLHPAETGAEYEAYEDLEQVRFEGEVEEPPNLIDRKIKLTIE